jgi:hypothetical protein
MHGSRFVRAFPSASTDCQFKPSYEDLGSCTAHGQLQTGDCACLCPKIAMGTYTIVNRIANPNVTIWYVEGFRTFSPISNDGEGSSGTREPIGVLLFNGSASDRACGTGARVPVRPIRVHSPQTVESKNSVQIATGIHVGPSRSLLNRSVSVTMLVESVINCFVRSAAKSNAFLFCSFMVAIEEND